jgi:hypothetical protein
VVHPMRATLVPGDGSHDHDRSERARSTEELLVDRVQAAGRDGSVAVIGPVQVHGRWGGHIVHRCTLLDRSYTNLSLQARPDGARNRTSKQIRCHVLGSADRSRFLERVAVVVAPADSETV